MNNKEVLKPSGVVYSTSDYTIFSSLDGNRIVNPFHVKKLVHSMKEKDLMIPIIVNEKYQVIDGQHRLAARTNLNLEVPFIICKNYTLDDVHRANANHMKWTQLDFLKGYSEAGNSNYEFMLNLYNENSENINVSNVLRVTSNICQNINGRKFVDGTWEIDLFERLAITDIIVKLVELSKVFGYKAIDAHFVDCYLKCSKNPDFDSVRFYEKCSKYKHLMEKSPNISTYLFYFDKIYNYRSKDVVKLK